MNARGTAMTSRSSGILPRKLRGCINIADLDRLAKKTLPISVYDHICGGAGDEITLSDNRQAYRRFSLVPRCCADVDIQQVDMSVTVLGQNAEWPLLCAPWGGQAIVHRHGEVGMAHAAHDSGTLFCLSTFSNASIEEVAAAAPGPNLFQLHPSRSYTLMSELMERARSAGYRALILTVDNPTHGNRERDLRNGLVWPPRLTPKGWWTIAKNPLWAFGAARANREYGNFSSHLKLPGQDTNWLMSQMLCPTNWQTVSRLVEQWKGPFAIKGIMSKSDALLAAQAGATAIIVSNQGGRHFDSAPAALDCLKDVVEAVGGKVEVILDGGIRRGSDIVTALALGARACMTARPFALGLAAGGRLGAYRAIEILKSELRRDMTFLGLRSLSQITQECLLPRPFGASINTA